MPKPLTFIKLGGSLITDKHRHATPRRGILHRLANELREALAQDPALRVILGHGSGSFGHWEANQYGTRQGVKTPEEWLGFARVSAAASQLNRIVVDAFLKAQVPVLSLQPSASALANDGDMLHLNIENIRLALSQGLTPLIFGDVALDQQRGGTILSTEDLFVHLADMLQPAKILLFGNAPGVMDHQHQIITEIMPSTYTQVQPHLRGSRYTDVTGGMAEKVQRMVDLVQRVPGLNVWILTGRQPGHLTQALLHPEKIPGTHIHDD